MFFLFDGTRYFFMGPAGYQQFLSLCQYGIRGWNNYAFM